MKMPTKPREGSRALATVERAELRKLHRRVQRLRYRPGRERNEARLALLRELVGLYEDGVPVTHLGAAMEVSGQRAQQLVAEGQRAQQLAVEGQRLEGGRWTTVRGVRQWVPT